MNEIDNGRGVHVNMLLSMKYIFKKFDVINLRVFRNLLLNYHHSIMYFEVIPQQDFITENITFAFMIDIYKCG